jgi:cbb3-type cytochrome oxidase maturation protein
VIPSSLVVVLATFAIGVLALTAFVWAWRRGLFHDLDAQAHVIFEPDDLRLSRRWETPAQRFERETTYGAPLAPRRGEWGGAA